MKRLLASVLVLGVWTVPGLLNAAQYYIAPNGGDWSAALARGLPRYYLWALLTPAVVWLARRFRPDRGRLPGPLAVHAVAAVAVSSLHLLLSAGYYWAAFYAAAGRELTDVVANYFSTAFAVDYLVYWTVLGAAYAFDYFRVAQERELRATRLEARLAEARLQALETQLNPHFLFNALHVVSALALQGDRERTVRTLTRLSDLLRLSLEHRGSTVPLRRELELVDRYLEIERARFADRLSVEYRIAPETWDAAVPAFLVQPLVENAIRHGIAASPGPGRIVISAEAADGALAVAVHDTGPGPGAGRAAGSAGIGLENTRARLRELYGTEAALELDHHPDGGALARVRLPLSRLAEAEPEPEARYDAVAVWRPRVGAGGAPGEPAVPRPGAHAGGRGYEAPERAGGDGKRSHDAAGDGTMRVVVVDDEPLARRALRLRLDPEPDIDIVAECGDGARAAHVIEETAPDLVFLDVRMPGVTGFETLRRLSLEPLPEVVFVTAYDEYAIEAFEVHALDYLLKPFDDERFRRALGRARARIALQTERRLTRELLDALERGAAGRADRPRYARRITITEEDRVYFVATEDIRWIESARNYVRLHTPEGSHLLRGSLKEMGERLHPGEFVRIHRSTIVNLDAVREVERRGGGDDWVVLDDGTRLKLSRGFRDRLLRDAH